MTPALVITATAAASCCFCAVALAAQHCPAKQQCKVGEQLLLQLGCVASCKLLWVLCCILDKLCFTEHPQQRGIRRTIQSPLRMQQLADSGQLACFALRFWLYVHPAVLDCYFAGAEAVEYCCTHAAVPWPAASRQLLYVCKPQAAGACVASVEGAVVLCCCFAADPGCCRL